MNIKTISVFFAVIILVGGVTFYINSIQKSPYPKQQEIQTNSTTKANSRYISYSSSSFAGAADRKRVLFFHAVWCPLCKTANDEFTQKNDQIPDDVVVFKTDYDTEKELKAKYTITYQHTFVLVDKQGNEVKKWNGGGIDELVLNTNNL